MYKTCAEMEELPLQSNGSPAVIFKRDYKIKAGVLLCVMGSTPVFVYTSRVRIIIVGRVAFFVPKEPSHITLWREAILHK